MAIDDNTSYELTGAQVKDLANKIKAKAADNIFVGATSALPGSKGLVPAPQAADDTKFLSGDGTWKTVSGGTSATIVYCTYASNKINTWSDSAHTTPITAEEIHTASQSGPVVLLWEESSTTASYTTNTKESWNVMKAYRFESTQQGGSTTYSYDLLVFHSHISTWMYRLHASSGSTNQYSRSNVSLQEELTAGSGIDISSGVISATGGVVTYYIEANGNTYNPWAETLDTTTEFYICDEDGMRIEAQDIYEAVAASSVLLVGTQTGDKPSYRDDAIGVATIVSANYNSDDQKYEFIVLLQLVDFSDGSTKDLVIRKIVSDNNFFSTVSEESIGGGTTYTAGNHIDITNDVISAEGYVWADAPTASTTPAGSITNGMIANNTLTASKFATGVIPTITLSTTDIGEGAPLAANTLYGVYE